MTNPIVEKIGPGHTRYIYANNSRTLDMTRSTTTHTSPATIGTGVHTIDKEANRYKYLRLLRPSGPSLVDTRLQSLLEMASPSGEEKRVCTYIRKQIKDMGYTPVVDARGNLYTYVGERARKGITMFSSHMDTVHDKSSDIVLAYTHGFERAEQNHMIYGLAPVADDDGKHIAYHPSVLGADDKLGCYIMLRLIEAAVPGLYVFHVEEEIGRKGSIWLAKNKPDLLRNVARCIAFDRRGYGDIIGRQSGRACASKEFMDALAEALNDGIPAASKEKFSGNVTGSFTDSASYMEIVPECTNVSVGYFSQHGVNEHYDPIWLEQILVPALLKVQWDHLPTKRDPKAAQSYGSGYSAGNTTYRQYRDDEINTDFGGIKNRYTYASDTEYRIADLSHWKPGEPLPTGLSEFVVVRCIEAWIKTRMGTSGAARYIFDLTKAYSDVKAERNDSDNDLADAEQENERLKALLTQHGLDPDELPDGWVWEDDMPASDDLNAGQSGPDMVTSQSGPDTITSVGASDTVKDTSDESKPSATTGGTAPKSNVPAVMADTKTVH